MSTSAVEAALGPIVQGLQADGYKVDAKPTGDGLAIRVTAGPDACGECLVPKELMTQLVIQALADAGLMFAREQIELTYPDEEG